MVEDSQDDAEMLVYELRAAGFEPAWSRVETEADFLRALAAPLDVILSDYTMPRFSGLRALELLHEQKQNIPLILVSGTVGEETAVEAMKRGAADYLLKDRIGRLGNAIERVLGQKRLREEGARMQEQLALQAVALATAANAILITDTGGAIRWVNPAFIALTGYAAEEVQGQNPRLLGSGQHPPEFYRRIWETILAGDTWRGEIVNRRKDGTLYDVEQTVTPVRSQAGAITHFIGIMNDITARRRAEGALALRASLAALGADIGIALTRGGRLREVLHACAEALVKHLDAAFARIWTLEAEASVLELAASAGRYTHLDGPHSRVPVGQLKIGLIAQQRQPLLTNSVIGDPRIDQRWAQEEGMTAFAGYPLLVEERLVGVLAVFARHPFPETTLAALESVAGTIGLGIERKRGEEALQRSEERFRQLAENVNEVFWMSNRDLTQMLYINPAYERIWGRSCASLYADPASFATAVHPADQEHLRAALARQRQGENVDVEYRIVRPDGAVRWIRDRSAGVRDPQGQITRVVGVAQDITERRQAQERIQEQARLLDLAQDAIMVRDLDDGVLFWNASAERLYGWTSAEALGRNVRDLLYENPAPFEAAKKQAMERGHWNGELRQRTRQQKEMLVSSRWTLVRDAVGAPQALLVINTDITEQKKLEAQFLRAQRLESIGQLASGVAHDLNNLLAPILMAVPLFRWGLTPDEQAKLLQTIETSAQRGSELVKQLLTFGRGVEGQRVPVQPRHLIHEVLRIARETFPKSLTLNATVARDLWAIRADPTQLHQVLLNLAVNARDAMTEGGTLTMSAANVVVDDHYTATNPEAKVGPYVVVRVVDTGSGIPPEILDKIFDPFFTTKAAGKGTGLGLSTVLGIVRGHGGFVRVQTELRKGSTFEVYFPAMPELAKPQALAAAAALPRGHGEVILVVDDEPGIREATSRALTSHGYQALCAADGTEAVALYAQPAHQVQLVVTDLMMPFMDGLALARALKKLNPAVKIIVSSGLASGADREAKITELRALGVTRFLSKPYSAEEILTELHEALSSPPSA